MLKLDLEKVVPDPWLSSRFVELDVFTGSPSVILAVMSSGCNKMTNALITELSLVNGTLTSYLNYATKNMKSTTK